MKVLAERTFTLNDQFHFAELSGDKNPVHVDEHAARRLMFGAPVVHGIAMTLWALDALLGESTPPVRLQRLKASFPRPLLVGERATVRVVDGPGPDTRIEVSDTHDVVCVLIAGFENSGTAASGGGTPPRSAPAVECRDLTFEEAAADNGDLPLFLDPDAATAMMPALVRVLPSLQIAQVLATTRLVGMICPGRNSVFSELSLRFHDAPGTGSRLRYAVARAERQYSSIRLTIEAEGLEGKIKAFFRPPPYIQAKISVVSSLVAPDEFRGHRALIIGGSRGLGEITAKCVCAGGGSVRLTYHAGRADAERVVQELTAAGHDAACFQFDALNASDELSKHLDGRWSPTHLFYFATPHIFAKPKGGFSAEYFDLFARYYVTGFADLVRAIRPLADDKLIVFSPSSTALDEMPANMAEYGAAKAAFEHLCVHLNRWEPWAEFHFPRFPRVYTDQTATVVPVHTEDPLVVTLRALREVAAKRSVPVNQ